MDRDTLAGLYMLGLAFCAGFALAKALGERQERERLREEERERRLDYLGRAIQDAHGRIDAEKWLAAGGGPGGPPAGTACDCGREPCPVDPAAAALA